MWLTITEHVKRSATQVDKMAAEPITSKLSIRSLTAEAENNVNQLLSLTTDKNEIKNMAQHYQAYAVQIASVIGQVITTYISLTN